MKKLILLILLTAILSGCAGSRSLRSFLRKHKHPFKRPPKCQTYQALKSQLGDELIMEPAVLDSLLIIYIPDTKVYKKLIRHRRDGMQLDMVSRSLFQCGHDYDRPAPEQMGTLLPVKYKRKLRKHTLQDFLHRNYILYGQIPEGAHPDSTEFNIILYQRNKICEYKPFSNVDYSHWELLPTGLYKHQLNAEDSLALESKTLFNHLFFTIPFAHDQSSFQPEDIKPLYDSLSLTDFEIQEIIINAYTSVEGSRYHNHQLAERRAESIVHALQSFQNPRILSHVYVHENFEAFRTDIKGTPLSYLAYLPDDEIPSHLVNETLASIDTLLAKHRKAEIDLILHKKLDLRTVTPAEILDFFDQSIDRKNLKEAIMLQNFIFN